MTSLQIGLMLLGSGVIAALAVQWLWQRQRARPPETRRAEPQMEEPVLGPELREPHFGAMPPSPEAPETVTSLADDGFAMATPAPPAELADDRPGEPTPEPPEPLPLPALLPGLRRNPAAPLDGLIDAIATLAIEQPLSGEQAIAHLPATRRAGSKPVLIEGLDVNTGAWEAPTPGHRYGEFQAGVQLANRSGALNEIEYSEFVQKVQSFADALGALPDFPDMLEAVARAREIDAFASAHDAQLVMRLVSQGPAWSLGYVQQHAGQHGFTAGGLPGRLVLPSAEEGAPPVLVLQFDAQAALADEPQQGTVYEVALAFDVPQTASAERPFAAWCAAGEALARSLEATMQDDSGQPFSAAAFDAIQAELERLYAALAEHELPAGSSAARRLFS